MPLRAEMGCWGRRIDCIHPYPTKCMRFKWESREALRVLTRTDCSHKDPTRIALGSHWGRTGVALGSHWGRTGIALGSHWVALGSHWGGIGVALGALALFIHCGDCIREVVREGVRVAMREVRVVVQSSAASISCIRRLRLLLPPLATASLAARHCVACVTGEVSSLGRTGSHWIALGSLRVRVAVRVAVRVGMSVTPLVTATSSFFADVAAT